MTAHIQRLLAIAALTWKAAFRFRLFWAIGGLLLVAVVVLPLILKHDGTARGFTQILLTYTMSLITALLGCCTLWLACGTLARDIEECQIQVVAVKPVTRWEIWLGKWLGLFALNVALLALAGGSVFALLKWRASQLPAAQQELLRREVFVARGSLREPARDYEELTNRAFDEAIEKNQVPTGERGLLRTQIRETLKARDQVVQTGFIRRWIIDLGVRKNFLTDQPMFIRFKFHVAQTNASGVYDGLWRLGVPNAPDSRAQPVRVAANSFHEIEIPPNMWDDKGQLILDFLNTSDTTMLFSQEDGLEVLYREGGFGLNFARGMAVILCWLSLLAAVGLAAASVMSFPVAAFFSGSLLALALSTGTLTTVVSEGTVLGTDHETGAATAASWLDFVLIPFFRALLKVVNLVQAFSPIDALSTGRSITWGQLSTAFGQIVLLMGGLFAAAGIFFFSRRELATAQGTS